MSKSDRPRWNELKGGRYPLLPQTHVIIAKEIHRDVQKHLQVELSLPQLIYGSVKPDLYSGFPKLKHFKPQSFSAICAEISATTLSSDLHNRAQTSLFSRKLGIVTHYVADYFCVPHNDRKTYQHHFWDHLKYEKRLHAAFREGLADTRKADTVLSHGADFSNQSQIAGFLDQWHRLYTDRGESITNDLDSSLAAVKSVACSMVEMSLRCEPAQGSCRLAVS